jgi:hypothetical protein
MAANVGVTTQQFLPLGNDAHGAAFKRPISGGGVRILTHAAKTVERILLFGKLGFNIALSNE